MQLKGIQRKNQILVATTVFLSPIPSIDVMAMTVLNSLMIKEIKSIWGCNWSPEILDKVSKEILKTAIAQGVIEWSGQTLIGITKLHGPNWLVSGTFQAVSAAYLTRVVSSSLADFKGLKIGIGPVNSGTRLLAETILNLYGVNDQNTTFIDQTHSIHFDMMEKGELDVGFFLLPANNQFVFKLGTNPNLKIFSLKNSKAISRRFDYLYPEIVQAGGFDLRNNTPKEDIQVVSLPVDLVAKKNLDPSIVVAISLILKEEFKEPNIISDASSFPSMEYIKNLEVNKRAKEIIEMPFGSLPFLYKYLPFKFAAFIDKFGVNLSYIFTIVIIFRYIGFPTPYKYYQKLMAHIYFKKIENIYNKSLNSKLSEQDIKTLKESEKRFEEFIENEQASKIIREIKKKI